MAQTEAELRGYIPVTDAYDDCEEREFVAAQIQMAGTNWAVVGRAIWRHRSEMLDRNNSRLRKYREHRA